MTTFPLPITIIGNPENRRVTGFRAATRRAGLPDPHIVKWRDVAAGAPIEIGPGSWVRIDSPGEDAEVEWLLRTAIDRAERGDLGPPAGEVPTIDLTEVAGAKDWYAGIAWALRRIASAARDRGATLLNDPDDVLTVFDKARCHSRLDAAGVPVPPALPPVADYRDLRAAMTERDWSRVFVKPCHGSSASGVIALTTRTGRVLATTSAELVRSPDGIHLHNSLRVRQYTDESDVATIVDTLARDGVHVERWFPKSALGARVVDARVVVIAGRPSHVVGRASRWPMTNLHLGAERVDAASLRAAAGDAAYDAALATCVRAAECFPRSLQVAVDVMFSSSWQSHAVAEVNAFGDLLPSLTVDGRDTYDEQIHALIGGLFPVETPNHA